MEYAEIAVANGRPPHVNKILSALARKLGEPRDDSRGWHHFWCPFDEHAAPKLGVHLADGRFNCISCHRSGYISDLLAELGIKLEWESGKARPHRQTVLPTPPASIPGFVPFAQTPLWAQKDTGPTGVFLKDCAAYMKRRAGLTIDDAAGEGWGYCQSGFFALRLVIPIFIDGRRVSFLARSIYDFLEPKELAGQQKDGWWPRSELVLGLDDVREGRPLVLVEGIWDKRHVAQAIPGYSVVSTLGSHLSAGACGRLLAKKPSRIIFFYDGDDAGREGVKAGIRALRGRGFGAVHVATAPTGKDPDDLEPLAIVTHVEQAPHWMKAPTRMSCD